MVWLVAIVEGTASRAGHPPPANPLRPMTLLASPQTPPPPPRPTAPTRVLAAPVALMAEVITRAAIQAQLRDRRCRMEVAAVTGIPITDTRQVLTARQRPTARVVHMVMDLARVTRPIHHHQHTPPARLLVSTHSDLPPHHQPTSQALPARRHLRRLVGPTYPALVAPTGTVLDRATRP